MATNRPVMTGVRQVNGQIDLGSTMSDLTPKSFSVRGRNRMAKQKNDSYLRFWVLILALFLRSDYIRLSQSASDSSILSIKNGSAGHTRSVLVTPYQRRLPFDYQLHQAELKHHPIQISKKKLVMLDRGNGSGSPEHSTCSTHKTSKQKPAMAHTKNQLDPKLSK